MALSFSDDDGAIVNNIILATRGRAQFLTCQQYPLLLLCLLFLLLLLFVHLASTTNNQAKVKNTRSIIAIGRSFRFFLGGFLLRVGQRRN